MAGRVNDKVIEINGSSLVKKVTLLRCQKSLMGCPLMKCSFLHILFTVRRRITHLYF